LLLILKQNQLKIKIFALGIFLVFHGCLKRQSTEETEFLGKWKYEYETAETILRTEENQNLIFLNNNENGDIIFSGSILMEGSLNHEWSKLKMIPPSLFSRKYMVFYTGSGEGNWFEGFDWGEHYLAINIVEGETRGIYKHNTDSTKTYSPSNFSYNIDYEAGTFTLPQTEFYNASFTDTLHISGQIQFETIVSLAPDQAFTYKSEKSDFVEWNVASDFDFQTDEEVCATFTTPYSGNFCGTWYIYNEEIFCDFSESQDPNQISLSRFEKYEISVDTLRFIKNPNCSATSNINLFKEGILWFAEKPNLLSVCTHTNIYYSKD
jgi:hypothetical protein